MRKVRSWEVKWLLRCHTVGQAALLRSPCFVCFFLGHTTCHEESSAPCSASVVFTTGPPGKCWDPCFDHFAIKLPCRPQLSPIQSKSAPTKLDKHPTQRLLENSIPKHSSSLLQEDFLILRDSAIPLGFTCILWSQHKAFSPHELSFPFRQDTLSIHCVLDTVRHWSTEMNHRHPQPSKESTV